MSPGERAAPGRREPTRPQYAATAPTFPPPYYPHYGVPHPNAWLGAPLISMSGRAPPAMNTPVSKLAIHTQGAPLIIQNRNERRKITAPSDHRNHRTFTNTEYHNNNRDRCETSEVNRSRNQQQQVRSIRGGRNNNNTDAVSVASDESSGSGNSETMLPRIIKPRKRRKKDRKPNNLQAHELPSSLDIGDVEHCGLSNISSSTMYEDTFCRDVTLPYHLNVKVLEYSESTAGNYRVSDLGEALEATRFGQVEATSPVESVTSSCHCRYCDPVGQIWDAVFFADLLNENSCGDFAPTKLEDSMKVVGSLGRRGNDTTLRRSWSDPSSRIPERNDVHIADTVSAPNLYSLFPPRRVSSPEPRSPLALEISSEIVTSMNGQRDLEIKLFSTSPPAKSFDRRTFFGDKNESAVNKCFIANDDRIVNDNVVSSDYNSVKTNVGKSENMTKNCCSTVFRPQELAHNNSSDISLVAA